MKKLLLLLILTGLASATTNVVVSILPLKTFVKKIGGERVNTTVMVEAGASPHNYEPKPSQMREITQAKIYFSIGVEFERVWLEKFKNQNRELILSDVIKDINRTIEIVEQNEKELDPHIWVDPIQVKKMAHNIYSTLSQVDSNNSQYYKKNLEKFLDEIDNLDKKIKEILSKTPKNSTFMVFHPAWGYFAQRYNLEQVSVEVEGKAPKMRALIQLIKRAKKEKIRAIFTQPEFSDKSAKIIADNLKISVIKTSPLAEDWSENLLKLARAIAERVE